MILTYAILAYMSSIPYYERSIGVKMSGHACCKTHIQVIVITGIHDILADIHRLHK